jgi:hypothetical protein
MNHNRSIGNTWDSVTNLGKPLDEGKQRCPRVLLDGVEVDLIIRL